MDMFEWIDKGYSLSGTAKQGVFIAEHKSKGIVVLDTSFSGSLEQVAGGKYFTRNDAEETVYSL